MSRYIKLADALRALADTCYLDEIDKNIQELPSIDMVFCKDCKFWKKVSNCMSKRPTGYCDEGKRRE